MNTSLFWQRLEIWEPGLGQPHKSLQLPGDFPGAAPLAPCRGSDPSAVPSAFIKATSVTRGGDKVLATCGTRHLPAEPSLAPLPGTSPHGASHARQP